MVFQSHVTYSAMESQIVLTVKMNQTVRQISIVQNIRQVQVCNRLSGKLNYLFMTFLFLLPFLHRNGIMRKWAPTNSGNLFDQYCSLLQCIVSRHHMVTDTCMSHKKCVNIFVHLSWTICDGDLQCTKF